MGRGEQVPGDLIIYDTLPAQGIYSLEQLKAHPTFSILPAVKAGQVLAWTIESSKTWEEYANAIDDLTAAINEADPNLVQ